MLLYKYLGREDFFANFKLRITPPNELNDPRECIPEIRLKDPRGYISDVVQRNFESGYFGLLLKNPGLAPEQALDACLKASLTIEDDFRVNNDAWIKRIFDIFMEVTNRNLGVLSLSETYDNELMWSHYANSHKGFVVGFDAENVFFKPQKDDPKLCGELINVQYSDSASLVCVEPRRLEIPKELFFKKTTKWSYEREWRMIKLLSSASDVVDGTIHLFKVPVEAVREVIFGIKVTEETRVRIETQVQSSAPHVKFKRASLNHRGEFNVA